MSIYDIIVKDSKLNDISMKEYKGKVLLIVNTATGCGFTYQYEGLEDLYEKYKDNGLEILDFPCNQFLSQAPGSNDEIENFCKINYSVSFKIFNKIEVNGKNEDELFKFLKKAKKGLLGNDIKWNFTKFLVNKEGEVVERYAPTVKPEEIEKDILKLLKLEE